MLPIWTGPALGQAPPIPTHSFSLFPHVSRHGINTKPVRTHSRDGPPPRSARKESFIWPPRQSVSSPSPAIPFFLFLYPFLFSSLFLSVPPFQGTWKIQISRIWLHFFATWMIPSRTLALPLPRPDPLGPARVLSLILRLGFASTRFGGARRLDP